MQNMASQLLIWVACLSIIAGDYTEWEDYFDHYTYIDGNEQYRLYWSILNIEGKIEIGLEVVSAGWIALGISPQGKMTNADIVIGWINDDGSAVLQNRYTADIRMTPQLMANNNENVELFEGWKNETKTYLHFTRLLFPCTENSVQTPIGTARVIYAWNDNIPQYNPGTNVWDIIPHNNQNRGSESVNLLQGETSEDMNMSGYSYFDLRMDNYHVPFDTDTTYYCKLFKLPEFNTTQHIVRIDPLIDEGNEGIVHHFSFQSCPAKHVRPEDIGTEEICNKWANMGANISECVGNPNLFAWAVGGSNYYFPLHVGLEMGGNSTFHYATFDVHYDNQLYRDNIWDSSGIRIWYTSELRNYSAGLVALQLRTSPKDIFIPPGIETVKQNAYCTSLCSDDLPAEGVYAFANMLHAHTTGISLKLRHIRDGKELPYIDQNNNYDFDYQQLWNLKQEVHILPGDEFIMECEYSTVRANRSDMVFGGESSSNEMCVSFIYVYPKPYLRYCRSEFLLEDINNFWITAQENGWSISNISGDDDADNDYSDVFYDVTEPDALKHYMDFIQDNVPELRLQICAGQHENRENAISPEIVQIPSDFQEWNEPDYGGCNATIQDDGGLKWYIWTIIGVASVVVLVIVGWIMYRLKRKSDGHYAQID